ncbi:MAG: alpha/beta hydrolase [Bdellovibrio sp.]|nr:alpha/beta hydrolase [Bdellovibrio sp.]
MSAPKKWILLRGLARGKGHWGSFTTRLQEHFPNDQFELLDLPGNGERNKVTSPISIGDYVHDLRRQSQFVKDGEPFHLLAISLGAMVAAEWMHEFPHEVCKAHLICTSSSDLSPFYHRYQLRNLIPSLGLSLEKDPAQWESVVLKMTTNSQARREEELPGMVEYSKQHPEFRLNVIRQLVAASRFSFPKDLPGDVNLIGSFGDRLVSPACTLKLAERWGIKARMHPWSGHDIPIDDPQWLLEHLL